MSDPEIIQPSNGSENDEPSKPGSQAPIESAESIRDDVIGSTAKPEILAEVSEEESRDQENHEKTSEDDSSEQSNLNKSRELKLLLALSKEANLDTNISHKRKVIEGNKTKETSLLKHSSLESDIKIAKVATENKCNFKFPVTAEAELEEEFIKNDSNIKNENSHKLKRKRNNSGEVNVGGATDDSKKNMKTFSGDIKMFKQNKDAFCWRCHREGVNVACETCPRSYHQKCLKQTIDDPDHWPCPECVATSKADTTHTRSEAMKGLPSEHLCKLLKFAAMRMIQCQGSDPFLHPVNDAEFPEYKKYIIQPMDMTMLVENIKKNVYGSTQAFEADAKWLLHNSIIFNSYQSKLTYAAKSIIKVCKQEMAEIENCPNCYLNANTKKLTWFVEVCPKPHLLVWAKLKGFPYWPAKAMSVNSSGMVDVRFFGAHDRAWVHFKECFLYSEKDPNTFKQKRYDIEKCVQELNIYIENLKKTYGEFRYAPYRVPLDPENMAKQLHIFLPKYKQSTARRKSSKNTVESIPDQDLVKEEISLEEEQISDSSKTECNSEGKENKCDKDSSDRESFEHKNELADSFSNVNSPENDIDVTMEGYGTDDDSVTGIDLERRKAFTDKNDQKMEDDEDDDNDTQVPSNISVDRVPSRTNVEIRGSSTNSPDKMRISRRKSDIDTAKKRVSGEDTYPPHHQKISRRNSDQSVKSDSSRLSNISDKISRVDISENMEISLGNDDIGCVSISENISPQNGESSRSSIDCSVENKRKPVQVDIDNAEFTISPPNRLKISDQLIKRLADKDDKIEGVKKSLVETKSQTDILIEKFQAVVQHKVVDFNQPSSSSTACQNTNSTSKQKEDGTKPSESLAETGRKSPDRCGKLINVNPPKESESEMVCESTSDSKPDLKNVKSSETLEGEDKIIERDYSENSAPGGSISRQKLIQPAITEFTYLVSAVEPTDKSNKNIDKSPEKKIVEAEDVSSEMVDIVDEFEQEAGALDPVRIDKKKIFNIIHSSLNQMKTSQAEGSCAKSIDSPVKESTTAEKLPEKNVKSIGNISGSPVKPASKSVVESQISEVNSPSNEANNSKNESVTQTRIQRNDGKAFLVKEARARPKTTAKKRKGSSDDISPPNPKVVKLITIENIMSKDLKEKVHSEVASPPKNNQEKIVIRKLPVTSESSSSNISNFTITSVSSVHEVSQEEIKSEPESDDNFSESENLEAKRKYLSALNISEKPSETEKSKTNEIRTRAKAEEKREKYKIVDNLTRIIDDVALNYSAEREREKLTAKKPERGAPVQEGEIFVKSFAKLQGPQDAGGKQRARKSFPTPGYTNVVDKPKTIPSKKDHSLSTYRKDTSRANVTKKDASKPAGNASSAQTCQTPVRTHLVVGSAKPPESVAGSKALSNVIISDCRTVTTTSVPASQTTVSVVQSKPADTFTSAPMHYFLLPTTGGNYCLPLGSTSMSSIPPPPSSSTVTPLQQQQPVLQSVLRPSLTPLNVRASQNYIPQCDESDESRRSNTPPTNNQLLNDLLNQPVASTSKNMEQPAASTNTNATSNNNGTDPQEDEFAVLNSILPDNLSRAVSDLLMKPPPRLKPKPPGILKQVFDEGTPSSAGTVTARINSVSHRMGDYFRGMLIETLEDLGKTANPEAKIVSLQLELETQKYRHMLEMTELRKNVCVILKDIQRSILEEREKAINDTRATCEAETIKRVELAKSKQWCANCSKEAQFYCCWNTSYCDYPCQQKHWPQHMGKCTQSIEKTNNSTTLPNRPSPQIVLRPAGPPKPGVARIVPKPTKVYPRASAPLKTYKNLSSPANHITVIETVPSFEMVPGKYLSSNSAVLNSKLKPTNTNATPSTSYTLPPGGMGSSTRPTPSTSSALRTPPSRLAYSPMSNDVDEN